MDIDLFDWQQTQLHALLNAPSDAEFFKVLERAANELGFDYCAYGMRMPLPLSNPKLLMLNNYAPEWQARYASQNYLAIDPTVAHGMRSILPLLWSQELFDNCRPFWEEARAHGLQVGWAQSAYDAKGVVGLLTLARSGEPISESEMRAKSMRMSWLVQVAHQGMTRLQASRNPVEEAPLTAREIEVLRWTADGKTSSEVGQIMNISERTVNFHINNSLEKLSAVNKTACVIKAAMLRLL